MGPGRRNGWVNQRLLASVLTDPDRRVSNRAAEVLCERGEAAWFADQLSTHKDIPSERKRLVQALGHAGNLPLRGDQVVQELSGADRRRVARSATWQLLDEHKLSLLIIFGLAYSINAIGSGSRSVALSGARVSTLDAAPSAGGRAFATLRARAESRLLRKALPRA